MNPDQAGRVKTKLTHKSKSTKYEEIIYQKSSDFLEPIKFYHTRAHTRTSKISYENT